MKPPRDLSANQLVKALKVLGYSIDHQRGSHIRIVTQLHGQHHETIPIHSPIKASTLEHPSAKSRATNASKKSKGFPGPTLLHRASVTRVVIMESLVNHKQRSGLYLHHDPMLAVGLYRRCSRLTSQKKS
jgi:predicted RNA binding protein YcfA (HicA-like mRNA interferase family)